MLPFTNINYKTISAYAIYLMNTWSMILTNFTYNIGYIHLCNISLCVCTNVALNTNILNNKSNSLN